MYLKKLVGFILCPPTTNPQPKTKEPDSESL